MIKLINQPTGFKARLLLTHSVTLGKSFLLGEWEKGSGPNSLSVPFKLTFCDLYQQLLPCHSSLALDCGLRKPGPPCPWLPSKQSVPSKDWWAEPLGEVSDGLAGVVEAGEATHSEGRGRQGAALQLLNKGHPFPHQRSSLSKYQSPTFR